MNGWMLTKATKVHVYVHFLSFFPKSTALLMAAVLLYNTDWCLQIGFCVLFLFPIQFDIAHSGFCRIFATCKRKAFASWSLHVCLFLQSRSHLYQEQQSVPASLACLWPDVGLPKPQPQVVETQMDHWKCSEESHQALLSWSEQLCLDN